LRKSIQIAVVAPSAPCEFWDESWKGVWSAACELSPFGLKVESYETDGHDALAQRRILSRLVASRPAAVALIPAHAADLNTEIDRLVELGIPVVTFHADAPASGRESYVGTDPKQSGALAGELLAKLMGGRGTIASFPGGFETEHLSRRYIAFRDELKHRAPEIRESICHRGYGALREAALTALQTNREIGGIYVGCSRTHLVAGALEELGLRIPCVGFDQTAATAPYLANGTVSALIDESAYQQAYLAVQQAYEMTLGAVDERVEWVRVSPKVVLASNAVTQADDAFERLVRRRTQRVRLYQRQLDETGARLATMAETDPLTGLLNRKRFEEILDARSKDQQRLSLLMVGLNGLAHPFGDEALKTLAKVVQGQARPQDYCARLSATEFGLLMPDAGHFQAVEARERIRAALARTVIAPQTLNLGMRVSIGLASMPIEALSPEDLLVKADQAMCGSKRELEELSPVSLLAH
jgi:diguanylate cyclase (GGDEF)-like protein